MAYTTIDKSDDYFNTVIWTGDDTSPRTITGVNFKPDFTWTKRRDSGDGNTNHNLYNLIAGAGNNTELVSNGGFAEGGSLCNLYGYLSAFTSDGFTLTDGTDGSYADLYTNQSGGTYVSWNWLASNTTASNTDGSITSTVSANTTSGFSIVKWTGTGANGTIGHGLGVAPKMIIVKANAVKDWMVGHNSMGWTKYINLNTTSGESTASTVWQDTAPTSSVFSVGSSSDVNTSSTSMIAYCFAEKKGFSKFGSYTGNGSTDGTFVYTGFKPAMVIRKRTDAVQDWLIHDNRRTGINQASPYTSTLKPNVSAAELTGNEIDILSNGFKCRDTGTHGNASGGTYIYMCFAENPLVTSGGTPTTAR